MHVAFDKSENEDDAENEASDIGEGYDSEQVRRKFAEALVEYKTKILDYHVENPQDPSAMIAMTKTMKRSMKCLPLTIQHQMHNFGKGTTTNRSKHGGVIKVNSPATSRRTFKVPGRGPRGPTNEGQV